jgi:hypothetical protein
MQCVKFPLCTVCSEPIVLIHSIRVLDCKHIAHAWCLKECKECVMRPLPKYAKRVSYLIYGIMGDAYADEPRRSVMMASTLGFLWASQPFLWLIKLLFGTDLESFLFFIYFSWLYSRAIPMSLAACVALWINGTYGTNWNHPAGHVFDALMCWALTLIFGYSEYTSSFLVFTYVFWRTWSRPRIWDIHMGNCCGLYTIAIYVFLVSFASATITSSTMRGTFQSQSQAFHAYVVSNVCFSAQESDPFSIRWADRIRKSFWILFILFLIMGRSESSLYDLTTQE